METKCVAITKKGVQCGNTCYSHLCGIHNKTYSVVISEIYNPAGLNLLELLTFNKYFRMEYEINKTYSVYEMGEIVNYLKRNRAVFEIFCKMNRYEKLDITKQTEIKYNYRFDT
jgi:hypothetical protein